MNTLIMFSGGADSTYLAYKLLTETTDNITLLSVISDSRFGNHDVHWAIDSKRQYFLLRLIKKLQTYRNFKFELVPVDRSKITCFEEDKWCQYGMKHVVEDFNIGKYDRLATGISWEQMDGKFFKNSNARGLSSFINGNTVFKKYFQRGVFWNPLVDDDFHQNYNRWHVLNYLPEDLYNDSLICSKPKYFYNDNVPTSYNCGACSKCLFDAKVRTFQCSSDLDDWRVEKSLEYGGGNGRYCTYISWIHVHERVGNYSVKRGISIDGDKEIPPIVTNKEELIRWYNTIEYNPPVDYTLKRWGLGPDGWDPN